MDDQLDRAIDQVARRLTKGPPRIQLRAAVLDRLGTSRYPTIQWLAPAIAAAAIVLAAVFLYRSETPRQSTTIERQAESAPVQPASTSAAASRSAADAAPPRDNAGVSNAGKTRSPAQLRRVRGIPIGESAVAALAPPALRVPPLAIDRMAPARSLAIDRIAPARSLAIALIEIEPLAIAPLDESEGDRR